MLLGRLVWGKRLSGINRGAFIVVETDYRQLAIILQDDLFKSGCNRRNMSVTKRGDGKELGWEVADNV